MLALFLGQAPATTSQTESEPRPPEHLDQALPERQSICQYCPSMFNLKYRLAATLKGCKKQDLLTPISER